MYVGIKPFALLRLCGHVNRTWVFCSETLPVEYLGGKPLCMNQYYEVLSSCRIPGLKRDAVVNHAKSSRPPKHITVVHNLQVSTTSLLHASIKQYMDKEILIQLQHVKQNNNEKSDRVLTDMSLLLLELVLLVGRVQQWWDTTDRWSALCSAGEDLQLLIAEQHGACGHPHHLASWLLGQGLPQPHQGWATRHVSLYLHL